MRRFLKVMLLGTLLLAAQCQNGGETANAAGDTKTPTDFPANTMQFKLDGVQKTLSGIALTSNANEWFIGKQAEGRYILISPKAVLASGDFDNASNPPYALQFPDGGNAYTSFATPLTFKITVTNTEITGTFSGHVKVTGGPAIPVTEGRFRVNL